MWIPGRGWSQPSVGEVAGARHCSLGQRGEHQSQRGREAGGPGAGRGEVTAWLLEAGHCIVQQPTGGNYVEVSALPLATCPLHLVMMGAGAGAGVWPRCVTDRLLSRDCSTAACSEILTSHLTSSDALTLSTGCLKNICAASK